MSVKEIRRPRQKRTENECKALTLDVQMTRKEFKDLRQIMGSPKGLHYRFFIDAEASALVLRFEENDIGLKDSKRDGIIPQSQKDYLS